MRRTLVAATETDDFDLDLEEAEPEETEFGSRPVVGVGDVLLGLAQPKPYSINVYNLTDDSSSGIAGTLFPNGRFVPLPARNLPHETVYWDEVVARKVPGLVVWDSVVAGTIEFPEDPAEPYRRRTDAAITGEWPNNPPRAGRLVNPEKARLAALEAEENKKWN